MCGTGIGTGAASAWAGGGVAGVDGGSETESLGTVVGVLGGFRIRIKRGIATAIIYFHDFLTQFVCRSKSITVPKTTKAHRAIH
jgi:hypothetical protein